MYKLFVLVAVFLIMPGCASIVSGQNQSISVQTIDKGEKLAGAGCELVNDKGTWFVTTPGSVNVRRSYNELNVKCSKEGVDPGILAVGSATKGMAFGNILFGGVIGAGVDISTGAAYDYPPLITVKMGETTTIKPEPVNEDNKQETAALEKIETAPTDKLD